MQQCNAVVRKILNMQVLNIVVGGLVETYRMLDADKQIKGRGLLPHFIVTPYEWDNKEERDLFRLLCDHLDTRMPFDLKSGFGKIDFAQRLYWVCDGVIDGLKDFLYIAGCRALNEGSPQIGMDHCATAWDVVKPPGMTFNPFRHDMAQAPGGGSRRLPDPAPRGPAPSFTKSSRA